MDTGNPKLLGLSNTDRVLNTMKATRIIVFPDGIDRSFTLFARQWFIYDVYQLRIEDPIFVATLALNNAKQVAIDLDLDDSWFEPNLRYCFEDIIKEASIYVDTPRETTGGNDNMPAL